MRATTRRVSVEEGGRKEGDRRRREGKKGIDEELNSQVGITGAEGKGPAAPATAVEKRALKKRKVGEDEGQGKGFEREGQGDLAGGASCKSSNDLLPSV